MEAIFLQLLNMSITASWFVLAVVVLRLLLKKAPRALFCVMWGLVALRLLCPFSLESIWSLVPSTETVPQDIVSAEVPLIESGMTIVDDTINPILTDMVMLDGTTTANPGINPMQMILFVASNIWIVGMAFMVLYMIISYLRIYCKVRESLWVSENIFICDRIDTPFIFGFLRPRIYLPSAMQEADQEYVIAHEKAHLHRHDHWWKPLGYLFLTVYWFNPILWVAYILLCKDIELACDEKVIKQLGVESKKPYASALINCSAPRKMLTACPLAFGETGVKSRIKSVLNYKKPAFWMILIALIACVVVSVCFLTNPEMDTTDEPEQTLTSSPTPIKTNNEEAAANELLWYDRTRDYDTMWYGNGLQKELPEYPGVTFQMIQNNIEAIADGKTTLLFDRTPMENAFWLDVTKDGKRDLCITAYIGSDIIDARIIVYDYARKQRIELEARGEYDYTLSLYQNQVYVVQSVYTQEEAIAVGNLTYTMKNEEPTLKMEHVIPANTANPGIIPSRLWVDGGVYFYQDYEETNDKTVIDRIYFMNQEEQAQLNKKLSGLDWTWDGHIIRESPTYSGYFYVNGEKYFFAYDSDVKGEIYYRKKNTFCKDVDEVLEFIKNLQV